tara:strand:+ start:177 stop:1076 length:900 start_codon:yes stop_codon:yes gene_type:complete
MKLVTKIITSEPKVVWNSKCILGEGTLWVKEHNSIYFVDIKKKKIFILNNKTKRKKNIKVNKEIGFLAHIKKNTFILGLQGELRILNFKTKKIIKSIKIERNIRLNRINDGKTDPIGRLWFGTMDNLERSIKKGSLYCLDQKLNLKKVDTNYYITNGPAFINSNNFYHTDSRARRIYKIRVNKNLKIIQKKIFKKFSIKNGVPDGMTVDTNKNLWVTHFHGAKISVFNKKGNIIHTIKLPAKNITNCAFGGNNNSEVFVTSALKSMNKNEIKKYKYSGALFKIKTNIRGILQKKYNVRL